MISMNDSLSADFLDEKFYEELSETSSKIQVKELIDRYLIGQDYGDCLQREALTTIIYEAIDFCKESQCKFALAQKYINQFLATIISSSESSPIDFLIPLKELSNDINVRICFNVICHSHFNSSFFLLFFGAGTKANLHILYEAATINKLLQVHHAKSSHLPGYKNRYASPADPRHCQS